VGTSHKTQERLALRESLRFHSWRERVNHSTPFYCFLLCFFPSMHKSTHVGTDPVKPASASEHVAEPCLHRSRRTAGLGAIGDVDRERKLTCFEDVLASVCQGGKISSNFMKFYDSS
jgi:hypothetical protein